MSVKFLCPSVLVLAALSFGAARGQGLPDLPNPPEASPSLPGPMPPAVPPAAAGAAPQATPGPFDTYPASQSGGVAPGEAPLPPESIGSPPTAVENPWENQNAGPAATSPGGLNNSPPVPTPTTTVGGQPNAYDQYLRPLSCYCPIGRNGPVQMDLYLRNGISLTYGNSIPGKELSPGYTIQGGVRTDFFNPTMTSAWVLDLGLMNTFNHDGNPVPFAASMLVPTATSAARVNFGENGVPGLLLHSLNRTWANFGLGKMWYITGAANSPGKRWRWGIDGGGRYGTERYEFYNERHRSSVIESGYTALYTDVEIPWGCCTLVGGFRCEYAYTGAHILHEVPADVQDFNLMFNLGVRY